MAFWHSLLGATVNCGPSWTPQEANVLSPFADSNKSLLSCPKHGDRNCIAFLEALGQVYPQRTPYSMPPPYCPSTPGPSARAGDQRLEREVTLMVQLQMLARVSRKQGTDCEPGSLETVRPKT